MASGYWPPPPSNAPATGWPISWGVTSPPSPRARPQVPARWSSIPSRVRATRSTGSRATFPALRAVGFELDPAVFRASRRNLSIIGADVALIHERNEAALPALDIPEGHLLIVLIAPPWSDAFSVVSGLDLRVTKPPVSEIVDLVARTFPMQRVLLATQVHEHVIPASLTEVTSRCDWSRSRTYDIDAPGRNHGLLLGTLGWTP